MGLEQTVNNKNNIREPSLQLPLSTHLPVTLMVKQEGRAVAVLACKFP